MPDRLTPEQLARFRADYHQCGVTVVPLLDEIDALTAERDAARGEWDDLHREAEKLRTMLDERDSEVARLRAAAAEAIDWLVGEPDASELDQAVCLLRDALAAEGGG
jgi:predicted nuclease with TOPRIM domain